MLFIVCLVFGSIAYGEEQTDEISSIINIIDSILVEKNARFLASIEITRGSRVTKYDLSIWSKGRTFVSRVERPIVDKGTVYLLNEKSSWIYYPSIEKIIRTSQSQKILGSDLSFADIVSVNIVNDYHSKLISLSKNEIEALPFVNESKLEGVETSGYIIECTAKKEKTVNYPKIRFFVDADKMPLREEYYTLSGKLLGILSFLDVSDWGGKMKPKRLIMRTTLQASNYTVLNYKEASYDIKIPDIYFSENYMEKLSKAMK
jgi:outer membrane lipoprotein-sorting protein